MHDFLVVLMALWAWLALALAMFTAFAVVEKALGDYPALTLRWGLVVIATFLALSSAAMVGFWRMT